MVVVIVGNIILGVSEACGDQQRPSKLPLELKLSLGTYREISGKRDTEVLKETAHFLTILSKERNRGASILFFVMS